MGNRPGSATGVIKLAKNTSPQIDGQIGNHKASHAAQIDNAVAIYSSQTVGDCHKQCGYCSGNQNVETFVYHDNQGYEGRHNSE